MKKLSFICLLLIFSCFGNDRSVEATNLEKLFEKEGKLISVSGEINHIVLSPTGKALFLNFGADHSKSFTAVIFSRHFKNFSKKNIDPLKHYLGKNVILRGKIQIYQNKPEIIVVFPSQIKVIEKE